MRQTIRAVGWAIYVLWLALIVFTVTAVYSAFQIGITFDEQPKTRTLGVALILSLPFSVENNGLYDISDLNITTIIHEDGGAPISSSSTLLSLVSGGKKVQAAHNISITLDNLTSDVLSRLLFYDTDLDIAMSLALRYAGVLPLKISSSSAMSWGAPLHNLGVRDVSINSYNMTHAEATLALSFVNHSFFNLNGTLRTDIVTTLNHKVTIATTLINVPSKSVYSTQVVALIPVGYTNVKEARLHFDTSVFSYGPVVIPLD